MRQYDLSNLVIHPDNSSDPDVIVEVQPEQAGLDFIHFQARRLKTGQSWLFETGGNEFALVILGGSVSVESNRGHWTHLGERQNVFMGLPSALYLPRHSSLRVTADADTEFAVTWVPTDQDHEPQLITPDD